MLILNLIRGDIYSVNFPYTFDKNYLTGKKRFALILQEGEFFMDYNTVVILLITSDILAESYDTNVTIEVGTTKLKLKSFINCAQCYTVSKEMFRSPEAWCAGTLLPSVMDEVDEALYI